MRTDRTIIGIAALFALACAALPTRPAAAGQLQVRARSRVEVAPRLSGDGGLRAIGRLLDDRGRPIATEVVQVGLGACRTSTLSASGSCPDDSRPVCADHTAQTGEDGGFAVRFPRDEVEACGLRVGGAPSTPVMLRVAAFFGGSSRYGPATWETELDPRRALVDLTLDVRPGAVGAGDRVLFEARLRVEGEPHAGAPISFSIAPHGVDGVDALGAAHGPGAPPAGTGADGGPDDVAQTDAAGRATVAWEIDDAVRPGLFTVEARFAGTRQLNAATNTRSLRVLVRPTLTFDVQVSDGDVHLRGHLASREDGRLRPLPEEVVTISVDGAAARSLVTDADGGFALVVPVRDLTGAQPGRVVWLSARYDPTTAERAPARSDERSFVVPVPQTIPLSHYVWPLVAVLAALLALGPGAAGARRLAAAARRALSGRLRRARRPHRPTALVPATVRRSDRRPPSWEVRLRLWDEDGRKAVVGATVFVRSPTGETRALESDAEGEIGFSVEAPGEVPGEVTVFADLPRFEPVETALRLPHDGSLDGATLRLTTCRLAALSDYRRFLGRRLPGGAAWGRRTPRQSLTALSVAGRSGPAGDVVRRFEGAYYGAPPAPRQALSDLRGAIRDAAGDEPGGGA